MYANPGGTRANWQTPRVLVPAGVVSLLVFFYLFHISGDGQLRQPYLQPPPEQGQQNTINNATQTATGNTPTITPSIKTKWDSSNFLTGNLTGSFKTSLKSDQKYITGFLGGGMTNDFMTMANIIYLARETQRIPIIPPFIPHHIGRDENPPLLFSEVFDIPRFSEATRIPIVEWSQVKKFPLTMKGIWETDGMESIGCWSPWAQITGKPRWNELPFLMKLDPSYTKTGHQTILSTAAGLTSLPRLVALAFPFHRSLALKENSPAPSESHGVTLPPDEHLMCFDYLYFAGTAHGDEWWRGFCPVWRFIATNLRWTVKVENLAHNYLMRKFGVTKKENIPPFISVHVRHADFKWQCNGADLSKCFAPLSSYAKRVDSVRRILLEKKGIDVKDVVLTSDESDPKFWEEVTQRGWKWFDHNAEKTAAKYGKWYEPVLDSVFLSMGAGLVGSEGSTMSLIAGRRIEDWNGGIWQSVKWGPNVTDDGL